MVVVARDHQHRAGDGADGGAHGAHIAGGRGGRIKQISRHHQGGGAGAVASDAADGLNAAQAQSRPLIRVANAAIGLADLPVGAVDYRDGRGWARQDCNSC